MPFNLARFIKIVGAKPGNIFSRCISDAVIKRTGCATVRFAEVAHTALIFTNLIGIQRRSVINYNDFKRLIGLSQRTANSQLYIGTIIKRNDD
ncbi:hypothetical protein D3C73_1355620 [compost metagenome]